MPTRRRFLGRALAGLAASLLGGCDKDSARGWVIHLIGFTERMSKTVHDALGSRDALAREYSEADITPRFRSNGTTAPGDAAYQALVETGFQNWQLVVDGLVERPLRLSLAEIRSLPSRTQITRHDCVEGWSCIAKWTGARLDALLDAAGARPEARYVVFHCADPMEDGETKFYESVDIAEARHPQTILAYEMNGETLPISNGAPLRLRVERQLGYKMAKYVMRIELVDSFAMLGGGHGSYWADKGYEWYAGI